MTTRGDCISKFVNNRFGEPSFQLHSVSENYCNMKFAIDDIFPFVFVFHIHLSPIMIYFAGFIYWTPNFILRTLYLHCKNLFFHVNLNISIIHYRSALVHTVWEGQVRRPT